jgi:hypothetical protein
MLAILIPGQTGNGNTYTRAALMIISRPMRAAVMIPLTLNLTIGQADIHSVPVTACGSYTWTLR